MRPDMPVPRSSSRSTAMVGGGWSGWPGYLAAVKLLRALGLSRRPVGQIPVSAGSRPAVTAATRVAWSRSVWSA